MFGFNKNIKCNDEKKVMKVDEIETLEEVQAFLNNIPCINSGGCGISALSMYLWLVKTKRMNNIQAERKIKFVYLYNRKELYLNNMKQALRNSEGRIRAPCHCVLLYNGKFIDSEGDYDITIYPWIQIIDEEEFIEKSINTEKVWNHHFNRKESIPLIEETLGINLSFVKNKEEGDD